MESEDKIERRSRSLSAAADDAALAVPVGDRVMQWLSRFRTVASAGVGARGTFHADMLVYGVAILKP